MIDQSFWRAIVFSIPLVIALVCLALTLLDVLRHVHPVRRRTGLRMVAAYSILSLVWVGFVLHSLVPSVFIYSLPIFVPLIMAGAVSIHHLTLTITDTTGEGQKGLSPIHFTAPALMVVAMTLTMLNVPFEQLYEIIYGGVRSATEYIVVGVCVIFIVSYRFMSFAKIVRYRRETKGQKNNRHRRMLGWLMAFKIVDTVVLPLPACALIAGVYPFTELGAWWVVAVLPSVVVYLMSCYNLLSDNYFIVEPDASTADPATLEPRLNRARVEKYLEEGRRWTDPAFRINDMAKDLFSNRAYISAFINREYKVNFNRFINDYRLREVDRLLAEHSARNKKANIHQIIASAGFSHYRSYVRAKAAEANGER